MQVLTGILSENDTQWAQKYLDDGVSVDEVLKSLIDSGWPDHLAKKALSLPYSEPKIRTIPEPNLHDWPSRIDLDDRKVKVLMNLRHPRVVLFSELLSHYECDKVIEAAREKGLTRSTVINHDDPGNKLDDGRTSEGMCFSHHESELIYTIENRISKLMRWDNEHTEGMQVLHYGIGGEYRHHYDYFLEGTVSFEQHVQNGGNRVGTLILYLEDAELGGGTDFADIGLTVMPHKGQALYFGYPTATKEDKVFHAGLPVIKGDKWIMTKWFRESKFQ